MNISFPEETCPKCKSKKLLINNSTYVDEETGKTEVIEGLFDAHCNSCCWSFIIVEID